MNVCVHVHLSVCTEDTVCLPSVGPSGVSAIFGMLTKPGRGGDGEAPVQESGVLGEKVQVVYACSHLCMWDLFVCLCMWGLFVYVGVVCLFVCVHQVHVDSYQCILILLIVNCLYCCYVL